MVLLQELQCFLNSLVWCSFAQSWCSSHCKMLKDRQYYYYFVTQFSVINKVLNYLACIINSSLTSVTGLIPFTWRGLFTQRWCSSPTKTLRGRQYSFIQLTAFTMLIKLLHPLASNINDSLTRELQSSFHSLLWGDLAKSFVSHPWKHWKEGSIPLNSELNS
jgi:hypothetical protein